MRPIQAKVCWADNMALPRYELLAYASLSVEGLMDQPGGLGPY